LAAQRITIVPDLHSLLSKRIRIASVAVDFTLKGDTNNPNFSLNENLSTRIAASMAGTLGVNIKNVAEGVGSAVKRLFGGATKKYK
jgi:hypothetical protein